MNIPQHDSEHLLVDSSRRLTGPSLVWDHIGAILDIQAKKLPISRVVECWYRHINHLLADIGWQDYALTHREFENGVSFLIAAPVDQLYAATDVLELAWYHSSCELLELPSPAADEFMPELREAIVAEQQPELLALQQAAIEHRVDCLIDDEVVSVGHGEGSSSWPLSQIPAPDEVDWAKIYDIPVAVITGTNGKSTTVRVLDAIAKCAGRVAGVTSTDFVRVGDDVLDSGDYSGPAGARLLLRDKRLQVAFLEVARGGILRRGLALRHAKAALITNVDRDHLGQYGVNTLEALIQTKFSVRRVLPEDGVLVLNADDEGIVAFAETLPESVACCWFSLNKNQPRLAKQMRDGGLACFADGAEVFYFDGKQRHCICTIDSIPMTLNGAALHNVSNALGAIGVAVTLGYNFDEIKTGLTRFTSDSANNPGRLNIFRLKNGATVVVDYAHNPHGVAAVTDTVKRMPADRLFVMYSSAGDRADEQIQAVVNGVCSLNPDQVYITEIEHYLRGRKLGDISDLMKQITLQNGIDEASIHLVETPLAGTRQMIEQLQNNDLALLLVLTERDAVINCIEQFV